MTQMIKLVEMTHVPYAQEAGGGPESVITKHGNQRTQMQVQTPSETSAGETAMPERKITLDGMTADQILQER